MSAPEGPGTPGGPGPTQAEAHAFLAGTRFHWHQRFELVAGVHTPGVNDVAWLFTQSTLPADLSGLSALDIGTTNGGIALELERRGAHPVVAVDVVPPDFFGFDDVIRFTGSSVEFRQASVYELPEVLGRTFDVVVFWGVLYHLRHPLLALDQVRAVARDLVTIETAVADHELGDLRAGSLVRFYRRDELAADPSNWFAPTVAALGDWAASSGFDVENLRSWPHEAPSRAMINGRVAPGDPEFARICGERPVSVRSQQ